MRIHPRVSSLFRAFCVLSLILPLFTCGSTRVPGSWTGARLTRADGATEDLEIHAGAAALVRFDAVPDRGVLVLRPR